MFNFVQIKNDYFNHNMTPFTQIKPVSESKIESSELVTELRKHKHDIIEKTFGNISSFNFSRKVFKTGKWNTLSKFARGLFINTGLNNQIVARGYDKFFNYQENEFNQPGWLNANLKFPVKAYKKYNGYLGLLGYDETSENKLIFCSKSSIQSDYANWFQTIFEKTTKNIEELKQLMKDENLCFIFEVIDIENDPHIIKYDENQIILLAALKRSDTFNELTLEELQNIGSKFGWKTKELAFEFQNWDELSKFINKVENDTESKIEGYVIEDMNKYMFKLKGKFYKTWKFLRGMTHMLTNKKKQINYAMLSNALETSFVNWAKDKPQEYLISNNIITLREAFNAENQYTN